MHQVSKMWPVYDLIIVMSAGILIRFLSGCVDAWKYAYVWCLNMQCRASVCIYLCEIHLNTCAQCAIFVQHKHAVNEGTEACLPQRDHLTYMSVFFVLYIFFKKCTYSNTSSSQQRREYVISWSNISSRLVSTSRFSLSLLTDQK